MHKSILQLIFICLLNTVYAPLSAQTLPSQILEQKTLQKIEAFDADWDGVLCMAALDLTTGRRFSYHGDVVFPQASSIKIPIMIEMFKQDHAGKIDLQSEFEVTNKYLVGGSGKYQEDLKAGKTIKKPIVDIITAMIVWSDNVATNVCIDLVGMENVNRTLKEMGFGKTRLQRQMMDSEAVQRNDENISTPHEMVKLAQMIYENKVVDADACRQMLEIMTEVKAGMRAGVPEQYRVAAKPGGVTAVSCETGIVYLDDRPFALSVMSTFNGANSGSPVTAITEIVFDYFERLAHSNIYGHRTGERPK